MMKQIILTALFFTIVYTTKSQIITTIAGNGTIGNTGDGGLAINSQLKYPVDAVCDHAGNIYITDQGNDAVRKIDASGTITHFATVYQPTAIACDKHDNIFVISQNWQSVLKITPAGVSTIFAGNATGSTTYSGDGGLATAATFAYANGIAVDTADNVYIASFADGRIRKVDNAGIITTIAGKGHSMFGPNGDGGLAIHAYINNPRGITIDKFGNIYIAEQSSQIRKIDPAGIITRVAGSFTVTGYAGDGGSALAAELSNPVEVTTDTLGNVYISDIGNQVIRKIDLNGIITTVVGNGFHGGPGAGAGIGGYSGDGGDPLLCELNNPWGITFSPVGELIIVDWYNHAIRKVATPNFINEYTNEPLFSIYPNPGHGLYHMNLPTKSNIYVYNTLGQELKAENGVEGNFDLNINNLSSGIYYVKVSQNNKEQSVKLIKY